MIGAIADGSAAQNRWMYDALKKKPRSAVR
jgi:hypothetical protein